MVHHSSLLTRVKVGLSEANGPAGPWLSVCPYSCMREAFVFSEFFHGHQHHLEPRASTLDPGLPFMPFMPFTTPLSSPSADGRGGPRQPEEQV